MTENCKKSLFIAILLLLFAALVFFSTIEDINEENSSTTSSKNDNLYNDDENSSIQQNNSLSSFLQSNSSLSTLLKHNFVGRWTRSLDSEKFFNFFDFNGGKVRLVVSTYRNVSRKYDFFLSDGDYIDKKFLWLRVYEALGYLSEDNKTSLIVKNMSATVYMQNHYNIIQRKEFTNITMHFSMNEELIKSDNSKYFRVKVDMRQTDLKNIYLESENSTVLKEKENINGNESETVFGNNFPIIDVNFIPKNNTLNLENTQISSISFKAEFQIEENLYLKTVRYALMVGAIAIIHSIACFLLIQRILESEVEGNTLSLISLSFISIWDMYLCIVNFMLAVKVEAFFHFLVTPAFCYFALFTVFETRLLMLIWKARYFPGQSNIEILRNSLFKFYMKFYFFLTLVLIMANNLITSNIFLFFINLYFIPHIIHSALKGQLIKPDKIFIFGLMLPRSFIVLYIKGCPYGIFEMTPSYFLTATIILVLGLQIMFIYLQEYYGPRFFLPKFFFPQTFDYFTNLPDLDLEMCSEPNEDCVICLNSLHQSPNVQNGSSETSNLNNNNGRTHPYLLRLSSQKQVMQAPCQHKFHSLCLLNWMMIKMECPTCRHPLPPV